MSNKVRVSGACGVSTQEGRDELDRLLDDPRFHGTERARTILRYLAERHFQGCDEAVKAYSIALDVLGRGANFDASSDPIVRIEMSRLRSSLSQYYEAFGEVYGISISLPIGRYLAVFTRNSRADRTDGVQGEPSESHAEPVEAEEPDAVDAPSVKNRGLPVPYIIGTAVLAMAVVALSAAAWYGTRDVLTVRPSVTLAMSSAEEDDVKEADAVADYLVTALSRFRTLNISSQKTMTTGSISPGSPSAADSAYEIEMKYYADGDDRTVWWQVVANGGGILKSGIDRVEVNGRGDAVVRDELVSILAKRFASSRGVINILQARDSTATNLIGNTCVLKAEYELDEGGRAGIKSALPCLERTVALQPANSDALALLSRILVAAEGGNPATTPFERALTLANRAASLDPTSDRAQVAIMMAQFYSGRNEAAIAAGNQALAFNPDNPDVLSKLAAVLYSSGYRDAAVSLAEDAGKNVDAVPRDARIVLALDAYARGDYSNASLVSEQINCSDLVVRAIRAASLGEMASPGAGASLDYLAAILPDYRTSLGKWMEWRRYPAETVASLQQGLVKAGQVKDRAPLALN